MNPFSTDKTQWSLAERTTMITNKNGAQNFPNCTNAQATINATAVLRPDIKGNITLGYRALYGVETFFNCSAMCVAPKYFSFSDVAG